MSAQLLRIPEFPGYFVSEDGRVYSERAKRFLTPYQDKDGYLCYSISVGGRNRCLKAHRAVMAANEGVFRRLQVRHLDGDPTNNRLSNLAWGTGKQNWDDRRRHGRGLGEQHGKSKLTNQQVLEIRSSKELLRVLASRFGVSRGLISKIRSREVWKHI